MPTMPTLLLALLALAGGAQIPATDVSADTIHTTWQAAVAAQRTDTAIRTVDAGGYNVGIGVVQRASGTNIPGGAVHTKVTEVYYVIKGEGTLVTGGQLVNPRVRTRDNRVVVGINGPGISGTAIDGGVRRQVKPGDMVIIPAGTPHWFPEIQESIEYAVVRVDPGQVVALK